MDYPKEISELKTRICSNNDLGNSDQQQREIKNELLLKRNQVSQLRKELDSANFKNFELNKLLEMSKSSLKETEFTLKLAMKKSTTTEEKMKEINESYMKMKLKEEMTVFEMSILKENLQKIARDKQELTREVDELNDKLKYYCAFQNELEDRQSKMNTTIEKIKNDSEKLESEQLKVTEHGKKLMETKELNNVCECLSKDNDRLKREIIEWENKYLEACAQAEKLGDLINNHKSLNMKDQHIIMKIKFLHWEHRCKQFQQKNQANEKLITELTHALNQEIQTNATLISQNEKLEKQLETGQKFSSAIKQEMTEGIIQID